LPIVRPAVGFPLRIPIPQVDSNRSSTGSTGQEGIMSKIIPRARRFRVSDLWLAAVLAVAGTGTWIASGESGPDLLEPFANPTGAARTISTAGRINRNNPFFQVLGANGRSCITCHRPETGWTITPTSARDRFEATEGLDPIFRTNDGSNSPFTDVSTVEARRNAYSMLLRKGLIRIGIGIPANAEFTLVEVDDPYGFASGRELSLFRRVLPSTNLAFLSAVMWDGRETFAGKSIHFDLADQSNTATLGHAEATAPLTSVQEEEIVAFETSLFTAQVYDVAAGDLRAQGAKGGPKILSKQEFYLGINDPLGLNPEGTPFTPVIFTNFEAWARLKISHGDQADEEDRGRTAARLAVARGEELFNSKPINITGVKGLNDELGVTSIRGTCGTCHDSPNVGDHSLPAPLDIGIADASRRTPDMPLYTLRNNSTGEMIQTTDPGRALITGRWKDIGRFKGPILRGLASRAPYFHNGSAATLADAVQFYNERFAIGLTDDEVSDLVAFLRCQ
jgi:cytochrome c peroxidase